ncbi:hypothetical protein [Ammoniphilus sp. CFH 90114]|nr:hypothetical protein [Ammoniphilus sp. CFH 90114]
MLKKVAATTFILALAVGTMVFAESNANPSCPVVKEECQQMMASCPMMK